MLPDIVQLVLAVLVSDSSSAATVSTGPTALPTTTIWLLLAGGVTYSLGVIFHLWDKLKFHNVVWHCFVVAGATLHPWAIFDCMVFSRV